MKKITSRLTFTSKLSASIFIGVLVVLSATASIYTSVFNSDNDPGKVEEMQQFMQMIDFNATHTATGGNWSNASTWDNGVPGNNARVKIPSGVTVTVDTELSPRIKIVRVDGTLKFKQSANTLLKVETLAINMSGHLEIGTSSNPIQSGKQAKILILDNGNIDFGSDPALLSRGLIDHGQTTMYGEEKTSFVQANNWIDQGATTVTLKSTPKNWRAGDRIVLNGLYHHEQEVFTIQSISGSTVTLDKPTSKSRRPVTTSNYFNGEYTYVANYTRNIIVESENADVIHRRGHTMFMHQQNVQVHYALFKDLGRTNRAIKFT